MNQFEQNIINIYKEKGRIWLDNLPKLTQKIAKLWGLKDLHLATNLSYRYVLFGYHKKQPIVLKLSPEYSSLNKEAAALKAFAGYGVVNILNQTDDALLLERAIPGSSLKTYFPSNDEKATEIFCNVMSKLHKASLPKNHQFPHLSNWLSTLDKDWPIANTYLEKARILKEQLLKTSAPPILLHGDLHHDNILANNSDWLVIDPKGVIGDPTYEVGAFIRNPIPDLLNIPDAITYIQNRISSCANLLHLDKVRITNWSFVQAVLGYIWCIEDSIDPKYFSELIKISNKTIIVSL